MWEQHGAEVASEHHGPLAHAGCGQRKPEDLSPEQVQLVMHHFDQVVPRQQALFCSGAKQRSIMSHHTLCLI